MPTGSEPASIQDLRIALGGGASPDAIGSMPASVDDLQLVVEGMQEKAAEMAGQWWTGYVEHPSSGSWSWEYSKGTAATSSGRYCTFHNAGTYRFCIVVSNQTSSNSNVGTKTFSFGSGEGQTASVYIGQVQGYSSMSAVFDLVCPTDECRLTIPNGAFCLFAIRIE